MLGYLLGIMGLGIVLGLVKRLHLVSRTAEVVRRWSSGSVPQRAVVFGAIVALQLVGFELVLRGASGSEAGAAFRSLFTPDPRIGHRLTPGVNVRYTTAEFSTDIAINAQGVRDDRDIGPKAPGERRIVVLGDSLVLSVQVEFAETFVQHIERRLNGIDTQHEWRVINAGVQGYGPVDTTLFYEHVGRPLEPDIVLIVAFAGNDAIEAHDRASWLDHGPPQVGSADATANALRRWSRQSTVLQILRLRVGQFRGRFETPGIERPLLAYLALPSPEVDHGHEVMRRAYDRIATRAAADGAKTGLVLMPARFQIDDEGFSSLSAAVRDGGGELIRDAGSERAWAALEPLGLPRIDLLPILRARPDRSAMFFQRNVHLTVRGHEVVGDALVEFLTREGLVPVPDRGQAARPSR